MKQLFTVSALIISVACLGQKSKSNHFDLDKEYPVNAKGVVYLNSSDAKVRITGSSRTSAHVKIRREVTTRGIVFGEDEFRVDVKPDNGDLRIREYTRSASVGMIGYHSENYTITLELPEGMSLKIDGDDGDYFIQNINGAIDASVDDGDLDLQQCNGTDFRFRLDDGDINMTDGAGSLDVVADDADVIIRQGAFAKITADIDDGDFVIETSLTDNGDYFIESQDGRVSFTVIKGGGRFEVRHDDSRIFTEGSFATTEQTEYRTRLSLPNGNAKVDIRADDANVRLIARN